MHGRNPVSRFCILVLMAVWSCSLVPAWAGAWVPPTPEELRMGAPPDDPGANAVYLSYDEDDNDQRNDHIFNVRLKVLTQAGVERYSDVQVGGGNRHFSIQAVEGRTIHPDGTVLPFTGKPFVKTFKQRGETYSATVFSMPMYRSARSWNTVIAWLMLTGCCCRPNGTCNTRYPPCMLTTFSGHLTRPDRTL